MWNETIASKKYTFFQKCTHFYNTACETKAVTNGKPIKKRAN